MRQTKQTMGIIRRLIKSKNGDCQSIKLAQNHTVTWRQWMDEDASGVRIGLICREDEGNSGTANGLTVMMEWLGNK